MLSHGSKKPSQDHILREIKRKRPRKDATSWQSQCLLAVECSSQVEYKLLKSSQYLIFEEVRFMVLRDAHNVTVSVS